jgi:hypothetical protein
MSVWNPIGHLACSAHTRRSDHGSRLDRPCALADEVFRGEGETEIENLDLSVGGD